MNEPGYTVWVVLFVFWILMIAIGIWRTETEVEVRYIKKDSKKKHTDDQEQS